MRQITQTIREDVEMSYYKAVGRVRGECPHSHKSIKNAYKCVVRDSISCHSLGGGAYSDRVVKAFKDGEQFELNEEERNELFRLERKRAYGATLKEL